MAALGRMSFEAEYGGTVPVASSSLSSALWSMFGAQVVESATKRLKTLNPKRIAATLHVSPREITVLRHGSAHLSHSHRVAASHFPSELFDEKWPRRPSTRGTAVAESISRICREPLLCLFDLTASSLLAAAASLPSVLAKIVESKSGSIVDNEDTKNCKYSCLHPQDQKRVVYIVLYPTIGILYCHVVHFRSKSAANVFLDHLKESCHSSLAKDDEVFGFEGGYIYKMTRAAAYGGAAAGAGAQAEVTSAVQTTGIIETVRYVGTVPVRVKGAASGEITPGDVLTATEYMLGQLKMHAKGARVERRMSFASRKSAADANPLLGLPVVLVISSEGMRTIDNISREETHKVFLQDLVYFAPVATKLAGKGGELFACVSKDIRLRHVRLRLFRCGVKGQADVICENLRNAFKSADRADELRNGQPFMPMASLSSEIDSPLSAIEFDRMQIKPVNPIGAGQFGLVFLVMFQPQGGGDVLERAVKVLRPGATAETMADFLREAEILLVLDHPNVVKLHGVCLREKPWLLMEENIVYGDLDTVLKACMEKEIILFDSELLFIVSQIIAGMVYVSAAGVVHSDLAARNCLVHLNSEIKIADFGWARKLDAGKRSFQREQLPKISTRWLAPECIEQREFSEKTDVWAAAVTIWECYAYAQTPYSEVHFLQVARLVKEGLRLTRPQNCSHALFKILEKCWEHDPSKRPRFKDISKKIAGVEKEGRGSIRDVGRLISEAQEQGASVSVDSGRPASEVYDGFGEESESTEGAAVV